MLDCDIMFILYIYIYKSKVILLQAYVAQRVGRGIALLFHDRGNRRGWVVSSTPRPHITPGKAPVPILQEAGWAPGPVWTGGKSRPHRYSIPDRPGRSSVAIPTELPGTHTYTYIITYIILYYAMLYYIILYYVVILYYIILCYVILYYAMLYYIMLYYITLYYVMLYYIMLCFTILCNIILYYMSYYIMLLYYITLYCYVMLYYILHYILYYIILVTETWRRRLTCKLQTPVKDTYINTKT